MESKLEQENQSTFIRFSHKIPLIIRAILIGFVVNSLGAGVWVVVGTKLGLPLPMALGIMSLCLIIYWLYFSGKWWPKSTQNIRRVNFRETNLSIKVWSWGLLAGFLLLILVNVSAEVIFRIWEYPKASFSDVFTFLDGLSVPMTILVVFMISAVAGICEETGFRGYMQKPIEKKYGPIAAILLTSIVFTVVHLGNVIDIPHLFLIFLFSISLGVIAFSTKTLIIPIMAHFVQDTYGFLSATNVIESSPVRLTIYETGVDNHFIITVSILIASIIFFLWVIKKIISFQKITGQTPSEFKKSLAH